MWFNKTMIEDTLLVLVLTILGGLALGISRNYHKLGKMSDSDEGIIELKKGSKYFLAFGDSLTEGFYHMGFRFHPYTEKLEELFEKNNSSIAVVNRGISGETTIKMVRRLESILQKTRFDFVCVLAGTNDLANPSETADSIFERLNRLYQLVLNHNSNVILLVVTIPPTSFDKREQDYLNKKLLINEKIKTFSEEPKSTGRVVFVDLYSATPYYQEDGTMSPLWDDHLHFSPKGYDLFGELVFTSIHPLLSESGK